jgi:hypothetical protein
MLDQVGSGNSGVHDPGRSGPGLRAFVAHHRGYRVKEILQELWDDEIPSAFILEGWGPVRSDYASFAACRKPDDPRPYLVGLTQEGSRRRAGLARRTDLRVDTSSFPLHSRGTGAPGSRAQRRNGS